MKLTCGLSAALRLGFLVVWMASISSRADAITISFSELTPGTTEIGNFVSNRMVFSGGCHYHINTGTSYQPERATPFGNWLGFDNSGCNDGSNTFPGGVGYNTNYLGPGGPVLKERTMYVAREHGESFSLESFVFATITDAGGVEVSSSRGGSASFDYLAGNFVRYGFTGSEWEDVAWLVFRTFGGDFNAGFDDLQISGTGLPEPSTLALLGLALAGAGWLRRTAVHSPPG